MCFLIHLMLELGKNLDNKEMNYILFFSGMLDLFTWLDKILL